MGYSQTSGVLPLVIGTRVQKVDKSTVCGPIPPRRVRRHTGSTVCHGTSVTDESTGFSVSLPTPPSVVTSCNLDFPRSRWSVNSTPVRERRLTHTTYLREQ